MFLFVFGNHLHCVIKHRRMHEPARFGMRLQKRFDYLPQLGVTFTSFGNESFSLRFTPLERRRK